MFVKNKLYESPLATHKHTNTAIGIKCLWGGFCCGKCGLTGWVLLSIVL